MKSSTNALIDAMKILASEIESGDGVANSAIFEASERLKEQAERIAELEAQNLGLTKTLVELEQALSKPCRACESIRKLDETLGINEQSKQLKENQ